MEVEKNSNSKTFSNFFPFGQNLQNALESTATTYTTFDFFDSKEENKGPMKKATPLKIIDYVSVDQQPSLIYDFAYFSLDSLYLLALISGNLIYFFDLPKKPNSQFAFRETIQLEIIEKKEKTIDNPLEGIFKPQLLEKEFLNCCEFGYKIKSAGSKPSYLENETDLVLACGGKSGLIYILTVDDGFSVDYLYGHINEVYSIKFATPNQTFNFNNILLSGSKDGSMILWNIKNEVKVAIFCPRQNPHSDILNVTWSPNCDFIVSVGLESMIKLWSVNDKLKKKIEESHLLNINNMKNFKKIYLNLETYKNNEAHKNFEFQIDQIEFYGKD